MAAAQSPSVSSFHHKQDKSLNKLSLLLQRQYEHIENYCNAQTALQNAIVVRQQSSSTIVEAVQSLQESQSLVQHDYQELKTMTMDDRCIQELVQDHVERTERVLRTILSQNVLHPNGLPTTTSTDTQGVTTVALATLRASIQRIQEILQGRME